MKLSIIVPVYKAEAYLDECISSILNQTFTDYELILIDDGSPDNCPALCDRWAAADNRIKVIHKPNGGPQSAVIAGINTAQGEYCGFIDSDDTISPEMYEVLVNELESNNADMVQCGYEHIYPNFTKVYSSSRKVTYSCGKDVLGNFFNNKASLEPLHNSRWNKIYRTGLLIQVIKDLNSYIAMGEDMIFNLKYLNLCSKVIVLPDSVYYHYRFIPSSTSNLYSEKKEKSVFMMMDELKKLADEWEYTDNAVKSEKENQIALLIFGALMSDMTAAEKTAKIKQLKAVMTDTSALLLLASKEPIHGKLSLTAIHYGVIYPICVATNIFYKIRNLKK